MTCTHPDFCQFLPTDRPVKLIDGNIKWSGSLLYQEVHGDQRYRVPNIWYNQPLEWHREEARKVLARVNRDARGLLAEWRRYRTEQDLSLRGTIREIVREDLSKLRRISLESAQRLREMRQTGCIRTSTLTAGELGYDRWWATCH